MLCFWQPPIWHPPPPSPWAHAPFIIYFFWLPQTSKVLPAAAAATDQKKTSRAYGEPHCHLKSIEWVKRRRQKDNRTRRHALVPRHPRARKEEDSKGVMGALSVDSSFYFFFEAGPQLSSRLRVSSSIHISTRSRMDIKSRSNLTFAFRGNRKWLSQNV